MTRLLSLLTVASVLVLATSAHAEDKESNKSQSYWHISFLGGLLTPRTDMGDSYKPSLVASGRFGWTSTTGIGVDVTADYSPLPRRDVPELTTFETHFGVTTLAPRFTLSWRAVRLWASAGAGVAVERTRRLYRDQSEDLINKYAPATCAGGGLDLHLLSSGGITFAANYTKVYKVLSEPGVHYKYYNLTGGLVFVFR
jgi:hypothetical protein